jgi:hypothetical protein
VTGHEQVWVKTNAPVDRGAMPLVVALSSFPSRDHARIGAQSSRSSRSTSRSLGVTITADEVAQARAIVGTLGSRPRDT